MGTTVLDAGSSREGLHLYAHCLRDVPGGVAVLAINNSRTATTSVNIEGSSKRYTQSADSLQSGDVQLNGKMQRLGADDALPAMTGSVEKAGTILFAPETITFLAIPSAANKQCSAR